MAKSIVPVLTAQELIDLFQKEAKIEIDGRVSFTRRGLARLTGKHQKTIQQILKKIGDGENLSLELEDFTGQRFGGDGNIPDLLVSAIIDHYAALKDIRCRQIRKAFGAIGLRISVHEALHWQPNTNYSERLKLKYVLTEPRKWSPQFPPEYYEQLSRLTDIYPEGTNRPHYWANLTNEFVYGYLPKEIEEGVRQAKIANANYDRLHQFLKPDGLDLLQNHLNALMILMSASASIEDLRKCVVGRFNGSYQLALKLG